MVSTKQITTAVVVLGIAALVIGVLLPVGLNALANDETATITQDNGTTQEVSPLIDTTLDDVETAGTPDNATFTVTLDGTSATNTIDNGSVVTFTINGDEIDVGLEDAVSGSPDSATSNYSYDTAVGYSDGAAALWGILDLAIVLGAFLFVVGLALAYMRQAQ